MGWFSVERVSAWPHCLQGVMSAVAVCLLLHGNPAGAQEASKAAKTARESTSPQATREVIRSCLREEDGLRAQFDEVQAKVAANEAGLAKIDARWRVLEQEQAMLGKDDNEQIKQFNLKLEEHNRSVATVNAQAEAGRAEKQRYNERKAAHKQRCATLVYKMSDYYAVLRELQAEGLKLRGKPDLSGK